MLTVEEARAAVLERVRPLGAERVALTGALGRVLAADVAAPYDNPPHDNSAMDGFAVRFADVAAATGESPATLPVIEDIPAGRVPEHRLEAGQASRIMTGAPVPPGCDTVIRVEDTRYHGDRVDILVPAEEGANIRRRGEDMREGEPLIRAGTELGAGEAGVLAAVQQSFVAVGRRPTVAVLSSGDELVEIDQIRGPGQIVNSKHPRPRRRGPHLRRRASAAAHGGRRRGRHPRLGGGRPRLRLRGLLRRRLGGRVRLREEGPRRPRRRGGALAGGDEAGQAPVLLHAPGQALLRPAGESRVEPDVVPAVRRPRRAQGLRPPRRERWPLPESTALMEHDVANDGDRRNFLRARLRLDGGGRLTASTSHRAQGSHILTSMLGANGIVVLDPDQAAAAGEPVTVQVIGDVA